MLHGVGTSVDNARVEGRRRRGHVLVGHNLRVEVEEGNEGSVVHAALWNGAEIGGGEGSGGAGSRVGYESGGGRRVGEAAWPGPTTRGGWARGRGDAVQVPPMHRGMQVVTRRFVAQAHTAGLEVHVWTIDDPEEMRRLAALNVDAIMTDVPTLALEILGS